MDLGATASLIMYMLFIGAAIGLLTLVFAATAKTSDITPDRLRSKADLASKATAFAEGFSDRYGNILVQNVPARFHNPGDLGPGDAPGFNSILTDGSNVVQFPDDTTGWLYLNNKWSRILSGNSKTFGLDFTVTQVAQKYAGNWHAWAINFSSYLGISPSTTLRQWRDS